MTRWSRHPQTTPLPHQGAITATVLWLLIVVPLCALAGALTYLLSALLAVALVGGLFLAAWALCASATRLDTTDPTDTDQRSTRP